MLTFNICGQKISVHPKVDKRLTKIKMYFQGDDLFVICPTKPSTAFLQTLLSNNRQLLAANWELEKSRTQQNLKRYQEGGQFWFRGKILTLKVLKSQQAAVKVYLYDDQLIMTTPENWELDCHTLPQRRQAISEWYKREAQNYLLPRLDYYAKLIGVEYKTVRLKKQHTCWGSCSGKGNINLNWLLIMAPDKVSDYVIVHELCHLRFMNHSSEFWDLVKRYHPDYQNSRLWLKHNRQHLDL